MAALKPLRFVSKDKSQFYTTLSQRVDEYFQKKGVSKHGNASLVIKTVILMSAYLLPLVLLVWFQPASIAVAMLCWSLMGVAMAGVGMSVMHDANHGAYSTNKTLNNIIGYSINLLGGAAFTWKMQHNVLHHTYTNIAKYDDDIDDKMIFRFSPHSPPKSAHRFQWLYAVLVYTITTLYWVTGKDFAQFYRYTRDGVNKNTARQNWVMFFKILAIKVVYFSFFIGLPLAAGLPTGQVVGGFLLMHAIGGIILTVIFQLAHTVEETSHPLPNDLGTIENEWAIHQMNTTVNFSRKNRLLSWYVGGLNYQVEHHLFPKVCHVHYPHIADIVKNTAQEFNVPYLEHKNFYQALRSHFSALRRFGNMPHLDEMMG